MTFLGILSRPTINLSHPTDSHKSAFMPSTTTSQKDPEPEPMLVKKQGFKNYIIHKRLKLNYSYPIAESNRLLSHSSAHWVSTLNLPNPNNESLTTGKTPLLNGWSKRCSKIFTPAKTYPPMTVRKLAELASDRKEER